MVELNTAQRIRLDISAIKDAQGRPATIDGIPVWASSNETVITFIADASGMGGYIMSVAPNVLDGAGDPVLERVTVTADADRGAGMKPITGIFPDIKVVFDPTREAALFEFTAGAPEPKPAP